MKPNEICDLFLCLYVRGGRVARAWMIPRLESGDAKVIWVNRRGSKFDRFRLEV